MALKENQLALRDGLGKLEIRLSPVRISWLLDDLASSDGHKLRCTFSAAVQILPERAEQKMFEETFLTKAWWAQTEDVVQHFAPALRSAAAAAVRRRPAGDWLTDDPKSDLTMALRRAGDAIAFACGLELLAPFDVLTESPTLAEQQAHELVRAAAERNAEGQIQHFQRTAELLQKFEAIRQAAPELSPGDVLKQVSPADQASTLQMLLLAEGRQNPTENIWAVAGPCLVQIDPRTEPANTQIFPLPQDLGPLRSVQRATIRGRNCLLIGARSGVILLPADQPAEATCYADPELSSPHGFAQALVWNDAIWACHRDGGIVSWPIGQTDRPTVAVRPFELGEGAGAAFLQPLDKDRLIFANGARLLTADARGVITPLLSVSLKAPLVALLPADDRFLAVQEDGLVITLERESGTVPPAATGDSGTVPAAANGNDSRTNSPPQPGLSPSSRSPLRTTREDRRAGRLCAAALLPWLGSRRLLLASEDGPIQCVGLDDPLVTQYTSAYRGVRALAATADWLAAISPDRMRLVLWRPWDARQPAMDLPLTAVTKHRVADVELG